MDDVYKHFVCWSTCVKMIVETNRQHKDITYNLAGVSYSLRTKLSNKFRTSSKL